MPTALGLFGDVFIGGPCATGLAPNGPMGEVSAGPQHQLARAFLFPTDARSMRFIIQQLRRTLWGIEVVPRPRTHAATFSRFFPHFDRRRWYSVLGSQFELV